MTSPSDTQRTSEERAALAEHITRHIFDIGVEHGRRPDRMEYKVRLSGAEYGVGGLNEAAMRRYVAEAIKSYSPWLHMDTAPRDGTLIAGLTADGKIDRVEYRDSRQCVLSSVAAGAGERGPGWVSADADYLPVDPPVKWRPL